MPLNLLQELHNEYLKFDTLMSTVGMVPWK